MSGGVGKYAAAEAGVVGLGLVLAAYVPQSAEGRWAALIGVAVAGVSGAVSLWVKQQAARDEEISSALMSILWAFGVRVVAVVMGLAWVLSKAGESTAYVLGFFGPYFAQQAIEIAYVLSAHKGGERDE